MGFFFLAYAIQKNLSGKICIKTCNFLFNYNLVKNGHNAKSKFFASTLQLDEETKNA